MDPISVVEAGIVSYDEAREWQRGLASLRGSDDIGDVLLLVEHPHVYTTGRRFEASHLLCSPEELARRAVNIAEADRGGSITYHGPGQLVGYPVMSLRRDGHEVDVVKYVRRLEEVILRTVASFGVIAGRREHLTGVWSGDKKLCAIGVHVSRGITWHGFALNISTDLSWFDAMVPCGIVDAGVASLNSLLNRPVDADAVAARVVRSFGKVFHRVPVSMSAESLRNYLSTDTGGDRATPSRGNLTLVNPTMKSNQGIS